MIDDTSKDTTKEMSRRIKIKAEQIARMVVGGMKASRIAEQMNLSYSGIQRILNCPEYLEIEQKVRQETVGKMDATLDRRAQLRERNVQIQEDVEDAVPDALQVLLHEVRQKRNLRAALELLKMDPQKTLNANNQASTQQQSGQIPKSIMETAVTEGETAREMLIRVPQPKIAEA